MHTPIPTSPDQVDADWLNAVLRLQHPDVAVTTVEITDVREVTNCHVHLHAEYESCGGIPADLFVKLPPSDPARREAIALTDMGRREERFYATLAPTLRLRVPACFAGQYDEATGDFALVLEDIVVNGCTTSDGTVGVQPDAAARALEELAEMHARYEDPKRWAAEADWVPRAKLGSAYGERLLRIALDQHRDRISTDFAEIAELYVDRGEELQAIWHQGPATVIHGDLHLGNLFDDHGRTGFLDWGAMNISTPMRDVSYFINMGMDIDDRRTHERALIQHYLDAAQTAGATPITFDDAWQTHRLHAAYTVPASCQIVVFPTDITEKRRVFSQAFLARAEAAVSDLEARDALRAAGL